MKFIFTAILTALLFSAQLSVAEGAPRRAKTVDDVRRAACRVGVDGARGSGSIIGYDSDLKKYLVLTNYHVVTNSRSATCEFWDERGARSKTTGAIIWRAHDQQAPYDYALIALDPAFVESLDLPYVPLAGSDVGLKEGDALDSAGCPRAQFVVSWDGGVERLDRTVEFVPGPYPGQSGSAIIVFVKGRPWNGGILTWLVGQEGSDDSRGAFIPVRNLWSALSSKRRAANEEAWRAPENYQECPVLLNERQ